MALMLMVKIVTIGGHLLGFAYHGTGMVVEVNIAWEVSHQIPNLRQDSDGPEHLSKSSFLVYV